MAAVNTRLEVNCQKTSSSLLDNDSLNNLNLENSDHFLDMSSSNESQNESQMGFQDPYEGIIYNVVVRESKTIITFESQPIFDSFVSKMKADFALTTDDNLSFSTHIKTLKCSISIDLQIASVTATGVGHKVWREHNFVNVSRDLLRRFFHQQHDQQNGESPISTYDGQNCSSEGLTTARPKYTSTPVVISKTYPGQKLPHIEHLVSVIKKLEEQIQLLRSEVLKIINAPHCHEDSNDKRHPSELAPSRHMEPSSRPSNQTRTLFAPQPVVSKSPGNKQPQKPTSQQEATCAPPVASGSKEHNTRQQTNKSKAGADTVVKTRHTPSSKTLLIGSSILHGVNPKGLHNGVHKYSSSGATIDSMCDDISLFDMKAFTKAIIYVGGNDASNGTDPEYFEEKYSHLIEHVKEANSNCEIFVCLVCPRGDTDVREYNDMILHLANHYKVESIDLFSAFMDKNGFPTKRYFNNRDDIHLSNSGVKRLLGTIDRIVSIVDVFNLSVFEQRRRSYIQQGRNQYTQQGATGWRQSTRCTICKRTNHSTQQCRLQQRVGGFMGRCYMCNMSGHKQNQCWNKSDD